MTLPADFWTAATNGYDLDPSDIATLFQSDTTATPVTALGQIVRRIADKSPFGNAFIEFSGPTAPIWQSDGTARRLIADGFDDRLQSAAAINPGGADKCEVFIGLRKTSDTAGGVVLEASGNYNFNPGAFFVGAPGDNNEASYQFGLRGSAVAALRATSFPAPSLAVLHCVLDLARSTRETQIAPLVNNRAASLTGLGAASAGGGTFGTYFHHLLRRGGVSFAFKGDIFRVICRYGPLLTSAQRLQTMLSVSARMPGDPLLLSASLGETLALAGAGAGGVITAGALAQVLARAA